MKSPSVGKGSNYLISRIKFKYANESTKYDFLYSPWNYGFDLFARGYEKPASNTRATSKKREKNIRDFCFSR